MNGFRSARRNSPRYRRAPGCRAIAAVEEGGLEGSRQTLERLRSEFSRVKARKDSLEEIISHRSYTTETVKRSIYRHRQKGQANDLRPVGVLADFVEVDPQYEKATEEFLHEELEYVVVRDWADAERASICFAAGSMGAPRFWWKLWKQFAAAAGAGPEPSSETGVGHAAGATSCISRMD